MLELILARHGQSHGNLDRALGPDTDLTGLGRRQATRLGIWLVGQGHQFAALYASPLRRARQTAEIVNEHFGLPITFDRDLRETEFAYLHTLPRRSGPLGDTPSPPFAEEYEQMRRRVARATARILDENSEGQILIVAHAGTLGTMTRTLLDRHDLLVHIEMAAVHCFQWRDDLWTLRYLNRQEHLADPAISRCR